MHILYVHKMKKPLFCQIVMYTHYFCILAIYIKKKAAILPFLVAFGKPHRVIGGFDKRGYSEQARKDKRFSKLLEQIVLDNDFKSNHC